jgi:hypothetical protein
MAVKGYLLLALCLLCGIANAGSYTTRYNQYTGKPDWIMADQSIYDLSGWTRSPGLISQTYTTDAVLIQGDTSLYGNVRTDRFSPASDTNTIFGVNAAGAGTLTSTSIFEGLYNTLYGNECGYSLTTGHSNVCVGRGREYVSGRLLTTGYSNILIGEAGRRLTSGFGNTVIGTGDAGGALTGEYGNTLIGYQAGQKLTDQWNTCVGFLACDASTTAEGNVAMGYDALGENTTGDYMVSIGHDANFSNTTGTENTALGGWAELWNKTGSYNTAVGRSAQKGVQNQSHSRGTSVGYQAGFGVTTGNDNINIGYNAGASTTSGSRNIIIGSGVDSFSATTDDYLNIGNAIKGSMAIGNFGIYGTSPSFSFYNSTASDADLARLTTLTALGTQSGGEQSVLGQLSFAHSGTGDDEKGVFRILTNKGSDGYVPTTEMRFDGAGKFIVNASAPYQSPEVGVVPAFVTLVDPIGNAHLTLTSVDAVTEDVSRQFSIMVPHYKGTSEEPVVAMRVSTDASSNLVSYGGGSTAGNAPTALEFWAAENTTTVAGTRIARGNSFGWTFGNTSRAAQNVSAAIPYRWETDYGGNAEYRFNNQEHETASGHILSFWGGRAASFSNEMASIVVVKDQAWTATAGTRDASIEFRTSLDSTSANKLKLYSGGGIEGYLSNASGARAIALASANALGDNSVAMVGGTANDDYDISLGPNNTGGDGSGYNFAAGFENSVGGGYAAGFGYGNVITSGAFAGFSVGYDNTIFSSGVTAAAIGWSNRVSGNFAVAAGYDNTTNADGDVALGSYNVIRGNGYNIIVGTQNTVGTGVNNAHIVGYANAATIGNTKILGNNNVSTANQTVLLGNSNTVSSDYGIVAGRYASVAAENAMTLGLGTDNDNKLTNTTANSVLFGIGTTGEMSITDGKVNIIGDLYRSKYAEIYISEETTATTIITANVYQPIYPNATASSVNAGFTFSQGEIGSITAVADAGGGLSRVTVTGHTLAQGDMITIRGTTDYNGHFIVRAVATNTFDITATYTSSQTGTMMKPDQVIASAGTGGVKRNSYSLTGNSAGAAKDYTFTFLVYDITSDTIIECPKCTKGIRNQLATEKFSVSSSTLRDWKSGDRISVVVKGGDTTALTINNMDLNIL